ncbi:hypothetical protein HPMBJEAJ_00063 [Aeromonas phage avDM6]|nr:hypothetical protein HPMBJEAJ_00063 [Aeromonas phage avDM6]
MKIKFKSEDARIAFASLSVANATIADYMKDGVHEAINHSNGWIELVDENGHGMEFSSPSWDHWFYSGVFHMDERQYIDIDGE